MRRFGRELALACAMALAGGTAALASAAPEVIPPYWSSDQIRAARPSAPEAALILRLRHTEGSEGQAHDETVTLAPSFTAITRDGGGTALSDHVLCRTFVYDARPGFAGMNCHALVAWRLSEMANRRALAEITKRPIYWDEADLGVREVNIGMPRAGVDAPLTRIRDADTTEYRLGAAPVVRLRGEAGAVSADEAARVARFIAQHGHIHPQVQGDLAQARTLPKRMEFHKDREGPAGLEALEVLGLRRAPAAYPLPGGQLPDLGTSTSALRQAATQAILVAEGRGPPKPTERELFGRMEQAARSGRALEALMLFFEITQLYPELYTGAPENAARLQAIRAIIPGVISAPAAAPFWAASTLAANPQAQGPRESAARYLATTSFDGLPFATFRGLTYANLVRSSGGGKGWDPAIAKAMPAKLQDNAWLHIAANPWALNAYKDAGDMAGAEGDFVSMWTAYDLGRAINSNWRASLLGGVSDYEQSLRAQAPIFF